MDSSRLIATGSVFFTRRRRCMDRSASAKADLRRRTFFDLPVPCTPCSQVPPSANDFHTLKKSSGLANCPLMPLHDALQQPTFGPGNQLPCLAIAALDCQRGTARLLRASPWAQAAVIPSVEKGNRFWHARFAGWSMVHGQNGYRVYV